VVALLAGIAVGTFLLARGPGERASESGTVAATATHPAPAHVQPRPRAQPTPRQRSEAAARRLAARLPVALGSAALLRRGASIYVVGGASRGKPTDRIWRIDLASGRVVPAGRFLEPLAEAGSARLGGALFLAGGWTGEQRATAVLRWTPGAEATLVTRLPVATRGPTAAFSGGKLYVKGGTPSGAYVVDVDAGTAQRIGSVPRAGRTAESNLHYLAQAVLAGHR
jgi:hypothetical protein